MKKLTLRKLLKGKSIAAATLLFFALYWALGTILPYLFDKDPAPDFVRGFKPANCYADSVGPERVRLLETPEEALFWRLKLITDATEEIRLSTYDMRSDTSGRYVMAALWEAAERDVTVDILVDGMSGVARLRRKPHFKALRTHPNVRVKFHNPVHLLKPRKSMIRLHDKYLIADDEVYLLGGRNINDLFMHPESDDCNFDRDILVRAEELDGETSLEYLTAYFDAIWDLQDNRELKRLKSRPKLEAKRDELRELARALPERYPELETTIDWEAVTLPSRRVTILHNPIEVKHKEPNLWYAMTELMAAGERVTLQTPYVIMSRGMTADLQAITGGGTAVDVLTNSPATNANFWGAADYLNQKRRILRTGVTLHETALPVSNHAKALLIDERMSLIGSFNCDMRSAFLDTELMVAVDSEELGQELKRSLDGHKEQSIALERGEDPVPGERYDKPRCSPARCIVLQIFRVVILPIRHLL